MFMVEQLGMAGCTPRDGEFGPLSGDRCSIEMSQ